MKPKTQMRMTIAAILIVGSVASLAAAALPVWAAGKQTFLTSQVDMTILDSTQLAQSKQRPQRPPQEAIEACQDKKSGDACSFDGRDGTESGTCVSPQSNVPPACAPAGQQQRG
ncbi:hypothetical protein [Sagittula sp. SSi028]|uniref:hypothetical protein n=1 Tax=Sagittula sp. SSi028 TaxID=3400636 RepID=UPI003AF6C3DE